MVMGVRRVEKYAAKKALKGDFHIHLKVNKAPPSNNYY
jgi:hypothetical protein